MQIREWNVAVWCLLLVATGGWAARADEPVEPVRSYSSMLNIDAMIDNYSRLLARKYNLTPEQDAYTQQLIREKTNVFLGQHRDDLFSLVDRLFAVRGGGDISMAEMQEWGRQARPLYDLAKQVIVDSNNEWRQILNDEQKKIHDADLQLMYTNFGVAEDQLQRIERGELTVEEFRNGRQAVRQTENAQAPVASPTAEPRQPGGTPQAQPARKQNSKTTESADEARRRLEELRRARAATPGRQPSTGQTKTAGMGNTDFETQWERWVRDFIQKYKLDEGQTQRANSILKDCTEDARSYMNRRKAEIEELDKKVEAAKGKPESAKELASLNQQRAKLLEPIEKIFEERLKPRIERLPTSAQREAAEKPPTPAGTQPAKRGGDNRP